MRYSGKRVHPRKIIAGFKEVFKGICVKKTSLRNFFLGVLAVSASKRSLTRCGHARNFSYLHNRPV